MKYLKYILALTLILAFVLPLKSQRRKKKKRHFKSSNARFSNKKQYSSIGGTLNAINYFGDIVPKTRPTSTNMKFTKPDFGIFFVKRFHSRISFRSMLTTGFVIGDDFTTADANTVKGRARYIRNLHFRSRITELTGTFLIDLVENKGVFFKRHKIPIPYFMLGIGGFIFNPQAQRPESKGAGPWVDLQPLQTEGISYSKFAIAIPFGIGVRYRLSSHVDISFEIGWRETNTDYIDDISSNSYVDLSTLSSDDAMTFAMRALEPNSALTGQSRNLVALGLPTEGITYVGQNGSYKIPAGYYPKDNTLGLEYQIVDPRGSPNKDIYIITGFHLSYIFSGKVGTAKFRR